MEAFEGGRIFAREAYVNATEGHRYGETEIYETFARTPGELYRAMLDEYGRCTGKVYVDGRDGNGPPLHVGWIFQGRTNYEDTNETYLREVWVTLHEAPDTVTVQPHYRQASAARP